MDTDFSICEGLNPFCLQNIRELCPTKIDVHIMAMHPQHYIDLCILNHVDIVTVHIENDINIDKFIDFVKASGLMVGIAVAPKTSLKDIYQYLHKIDIVNILTVEPGPSGQQFQERQLCKIEELKKIRETCKFKYLIEVDGSCNSEHYSMMKKAGADIFVVGTSGLFSLNQDIAIAWKQMLNYMT